MNAPIADTIKAEAARSLLERMAEKTKLVRFFRYNASAKHGVPIDSEEPINFSTSTSTSTETTTKPQPMEEPTVTKQPVEKQPDNPIILQSIVQSGLGDKLKGVLATLAILAVIAASIASGLAIGKSTATPPAINTGVQDKEMRYESPFQYLEDQGEHLP